MFETDVHRLVVCITFVDISTYLIIVPVYFLFFLLFDPVYDEGFVL